MDEKKKKKNEKDEGIEHLSLKKDLGGSTPLIPGDQKKVAALVDQKIDYMEKVEEIDSKLLAIQKSTKTLLPFMVPVHNYLRMRYKWYYNWHLFKYAKLLHWIILALYILGLGAAVYFMVIQPMRHPKVAKAATVTWAPGDTGCDNGEDDWNDADCWDTDSVPTSSDDVVIPDVYPSPWISTTASAASIDADSSWGFGGGTLTVSGSASFDLNNLSSITLNLGSDLTINADLIDTVTVNMTGATNSFVAVSGTGNAATLTLNIEDGAHIDLNNDTNALYELNINDGTFDAYGYDIGDLSGSPPSVGNSAVNIAADGTLELYGTSDQLLSMGTNSGMVAYKGGNTYTGLVAGESYHDLKFFDLSGDYTLNANVDVTGDLENDYNLIDGAYEITVEGDYIIGTSAEGGGATVVLDGTGNQAIIASGGYSTNLEIDKASGDVSCDDSFTISVDGGTNKGSLTDSDRPSVYWAAMKARVHYESEFQLSTICRQLKLLAPDNKMRETDCANAEGIFRIIQSIPSPKAEPFKMWLARVGYERIQEIDDPELATKRSRAIYKAKGYSESWIEKRMRGIAIREDLTEEWKNRGVNNEKGYAILTAEISKATFDMTPSQYKKFKNLRRENLRDHMDDLELIFSMLGEASTTEIARNRDTQGFNENKVVARKGGRIAGEARKKLEVESGKKVSTRQNYLKEPQNMKRLKGC